MWHHGHTTSDQISTCMPVSTRYDAAGFPGHREASAVLLQMLRQPDLERGQPFVDVVEANVHAVEAGVHAVEPGIDAAELGIDAVEPSVRANCQRVELRVHAPEPGLDLAVHPEERGRQDPEGRNRDAQQTCAPDGIHTIT